MTKVIACIDGSTFADSVCNMAAWVASRNKREVALLHVIAPHSEIAAKTNLTGSIGLGAKSAILAELTHVDEERGKLEQRKGQIMLEHGIEELAAQNIDNVETFHRRGSLVETLNEMESEADIIIMGKRGEHEHNSPDHLGSNLERVARAIHTPLLVVTKNPKPVSKFLFAYDGSPSSKKALDYITNNPLLQGLECHLIKVCEASGKAQEVLNEAKDVLEKAGFAVEASIQQGKSVKSVVANYIKDHDIELLAIGSYGHSKIRSFLLGSTTTALLHKTDIPVLMFH